MKSNSEILIYQTEDGQTKIETRLENETVWLTQEQISELFQRDRSVITKHIGNVFKEGELDEKSNVQILHISGSDRPVKFYNLDVIISVGYRVKSHPIPWSVAHRPAIKSRQFLSSVCHRAWTAFGSRSECLKALERIGERAL
jgi:hypothetical protein